MKIKYDLLQSCLCIAILMLAGLMLTAFPSMNSESAQVGFVALACLVEVCIGSTKSKASRIACYLGIGGLWIIGVLQQDWKPSVILIALFWMVVARGFAQSRVVPQ